MGCVRINKKLLKLKHKSCEFFERRSDAFFSTVVTKGDYTLCYSLTTVPF